MSKVVAMSNIHKRYDGQQIETHALQGISLETVSYTHLRAHET